MLRRLPPLRAGDAVVDLGCWPGAWCQVLAERVGPSGRVVGVDLEPTDALGAPVTLLALDFTEPAAAGRIASELGGPAAAVFCDASPKLSGIADVDRAALEELWQAALSIAGPLLTPSGSLVIKGFPGTEGDRFRGVLKKRFARVQELRPEGKRQSSREFYWVATPEPKKSGRPRRPGRGRGSRG